MLPKSLPNPDCLKPPKGAATSVLLYVLTKTVPAWSFSVTYKALLKSRVITPDANPYSVALARRRTPSMSLPKEKEWKTNDFSFGVVNGWNKSYNRPFIEPAVRRPQQSRISIHLSAILRRWKTCRNMRERKRERERRGRGGTWKTKWRCIGHLFFSP